MFTKDAWLLYDYNEELVETNDQYLKIGYNEKDVNIVSYDTIINKPNKHIRLRRNSIFVGRSSMI